MSFFKRYLKQDYLEVLKLAWPLIVANSFWNLQLTIDRVFLAQHSTLALGAALSVMGVFWTPMALLQQTAAYSTTFVAQYFGAKKYHQIGPSIWQAIFLSVLGGCIFLFLSPLAPPFFTWVGHDASIQNLEIEYFQSLTYSALPAALVASASGFFTGLGKSQAVMKINGIGLLVNALLDYLLISGKWGIPAYGIRGAGYATAVANYASSFYGFYLIWKETKNKNYGFLAGLSWNQSLMKRFLKFGLPSGMQWALEGLAFTVFLIIVGNMANGEIALSASSIAVTMMMLAVLPIMGVAQAASVFVGQHLGEKKPDLAYSKVWIGLQISLFYILFMSVGFSGFPDFFSGWFENKENPGLWTDVQGLTKSLLYFVSAMVFFDCGNFIFSFSLKGAGDSRFVSMVALLLPWPVFVVPTYFIQSQPQAIYYAWAFALIYTIAVSTVFWRRFEGGKWRVMSVIQEEPKEDALQVPLE